MERAISIPVDIEIALPDHPGAPNAPMVVWEHLLLKD
jgi:hypothetical protein